MLPRPFAVADLAPWTDLWNHRGAEGFQSPRWHLAHWETFRARPYLVVDDGWTGVLPLVRRWGRFVSSAAAVSDSGQPLGEVLSVQGGLSLIGFREQKGGATQEFATGSEIQLPDSWSAYEASLPKSLRQDLRRSSARIETYRGAEAQDAFEVLVGLHRDRWRKRGLPGAFSARRMEFHRRFLASNGPGRILVAKQEGVVKGAIYLLEGRERWCYYQSGIVAESGSYGSALIAEAIRHTMDAGVTIFDFVKGTEPYKRRWQATPYPLWKTPSPLDSVRAPIEDLVRRRFEDRWSESVT